MANNPLLYDAALGGAIAGIEAGRVLKSTNSADYIGARSTAVAFATILDSLFPVNQNLTQQDSNLMQAICLQVLAGRFIKIDSGLVALANGIATLFTTIQAGLVTVTNPGTQTAWAINPATGSDIGPGTPAAPLATMGEFNKRMQNAVVSVAQTLQLVGDVTDAPLTLMGTRYTAAGSLTMSGTVTVTASGTITLVTTLLATSTYQCQTTGIVWTLADVGKRIQLSNGVVLWVEEFVDANNVIVGPGTTNTTTTTPTNLAFDVQSLSAALAPFINGMFASLAAGSVTLQHLNLTGGMATQGIRTDLFGCKFTAASTIQTGISTVLRGCLFAASVTVLGGGSVTFSAHTCIGGSNLSLQANQNTLSVSSFNNASFQVSRGGYAINAGAMHFRNTANPIVIQQGAGMVNQNFTISGSVGNTGFGITVKASCRFTYLIAGTKPTVTGASGDTKIGSATVAYANIPYTDLLINAAPNTLLTLSGQAATMQLEN